MPLKRQASLCTCGDHAFVPMKRGVTLVDPADAHYLTTYNFVVNGGYAYSPKLGKLHRAIMRDAMTVDHKNRDRLDNRRRNLRACTVQQNQFNKKPNARGKSRFKGVSWNSAEKRWIARIGLNRSKTWLGGFADEEAAARAYDAAARRTYGEFAYLNFPEGAELCRPQS